MGEDKNTEKQFSEYVDKLLKGEDVSLGSEPGDELKETVEFAHTLKALVSEPSPAFQTGLKRKLLNRLVEKEQRAREARRWWQFGLNTKWVSIAATAVILILVVVSALDYKNIFPKSPPPTIPSVTTAPTSPSAQTAVPSAMPPTQQAAQSAPGNSPPPLKTPGSGQGSWAYGFSNLSDITAFSDAIVIATVDKSVQVVKEGDTLYGTEWVLRVDTVLKGPVLNQLLLWQTGSPDVPRSDLSDDPLFVPGERYLLFLGEHSQYFYYGPNGRYLIWNNSVYSMNHVIAGAGGYQAPSGLNYNGTSLNTVDTDITKLVDSVQLVFTQGELRLQADQLTYQAGTTLNIDVSLSSGEHGPDGVTLAVDKSGLPAGLDVSLQPTVFVAYPHNVYKSTLIINIAQGLPPGTYQIPVTYNFDSVGIGRRVITLYVVTQ